MSEMEKTPVLSAADQAAPAPKPKRPKAKSLLMIGEQTNTLFEKARLAKERGRKGRLVRFDFPTGNPRDVGP